MWQPTHVQVTVQKAKGLLFKGKNDSNDAFVVIALGKEKFQTSVKERSTNPVEWHEECDLDIPSHGNTAAVQLTVYHRNGLGMDEFLGQITLPLNDFDVYERPRTKSYKLLGKPDKSRKKAEKERGELEAKIAFIVKSGNFLDVAKKEKHKSSLTSLKNIGGSLLSLGNKEKQGLKKFTKSVSSRMDKIVPKKKRSNTRSTDEFPPSQLMASSQWAGQADPGVISDEEDDLAFEDVKVSSTVSSSPYSVSSRASSRHLTGQNLPEDERSLSGVGPEFPVPDTGHNHPSGRGGLHQPHGATYEYDEVRDDVSTPSPSAHHHPQPPPSTTPPSTRTSPSPPSRKLTSLHLPNNAISSIIVTTNRSSKSPSPKPLHSTHRDHKASVEASPWPGAAMATGEHETRDDIDPYQPQTITGTDSIEDLAITVATSDRTSLNSSSPPPSPDPFSLNINYANMTPVELPPPKPRPRRSMDYTRQESAEVLRDQENGTLDHYDSVTANADSNGVVGDINPTASNAGIDNSDVFFTENKFEEIIPGLVKSSPLLQGSPFSGDQSLNLSVVDDPIPNPFNAVLAADSLTCVEADASPVMLRRELNAALVVVDADASPVRLRREQSATLVSRDSAIPSTGTFSSIAEESSFSPFSSFSSNASKDHSVAMHASPPPPPPAATLTTNSVSNHPNTGHGNEVLSVTNANKEVREMRRRSSVPAYVTDGFSSSGHKQPAEHSESGTMFEMSRSSSQSGGVLGGALAASIMPNLGVSTSSSPYTGPDSTAPLHSLSSGTLNSNSSSPLSPGWRGGGSTGVLGGDGRSGAGMVRGGSVKEKRSSEPLEDEWERKLCGRRSMVGSLEHLSGGGGSSRSSLNNSCASSTHDLQHQQHLDHHHIGSSRFPEVKALTLERGTKLSPFEESPDSAKKQKRKGLKSRLFSKGHSGGRVEEEGRVVEGGNDRLPHAPTSHPHSRISQDIHNKFAGKNREDLLEQIVVLQSMLERQVRHTRDLEEYIDNLLLRVLDASPHILQAPTTPQPGGGGMHRAVMGRMS